MQQHFRENGSTHDVGARYDSETVRRVLGRAAEIEAQTEAARQEAEVPLTAAQVEALGMEVGLSPGAVRRALGELQPDTAVAVTDSRVETMPAARRMTSALVPGFAYALLVITLFYFLALDFPPSLARGGWWGRFLLFFLLFFSVLFTPFLVLLGRRKRRRRRNSTAGHILDHSRRRARRRG